MKTNVMMISVLLMLFSMGTRAQTAINTVEDLKSMSMDGHYYLTTDLEVDEWTAKGVFTGTFDGRGHKITFTNGQQDAYGNNGFFASTQGASISNVVVSGMFREFTGYGGSLIAHAENTSISNCETEAVLITTSVTAICGGLVGCLDGSSMVNCSSNATLEGSKLGGLAGVVREGGTIRNSYSCASFVFSSKRAEPEVGFLVYDNAGVLENNYVNLLTNGWYLASFGQLSMMMGLRGLCRLVNESTQWFSGFSVGSSMGAKDVVKGYLQNDHFRSVRQDAFGSINNIIKYVSDFNDFGYNLGDIIYINGVKCFVFYIHDDGRGGWATPILDISFRRKVTSSNTNQLEGYYNPELMIEAQNYEFAQWHGGQVAHGGTSSVIPPGFDDNPGKFFTYLLQEQDRDMNTQVNNIRFPLSNFSSLPSVKQLAYRNNGEIRCCYYPFATTLYGLVNGSGVDDCCRYEVGNAPYNYGEFGYRLYQNNQISDYALADTLNAWVKDRTEDGVNYALWAVAGDNQVNDNGPVHCYDFDQEDEIVNTAIKMGRSGLYKALRYASITNLSEAQTANSNTLAYYGHCDAVHTDNVTTPWQSALYITEEAAMKGNYKLKANVGFTMDNSDASGFAGEHYDWHMVSPTLSDAITGINYSTSYTEGGPNHEPSEVFFYHADGYFPLNTPYTGWDFYCYDEPNNGWPNFKRKTGDHYHQVTGAPINYKNESNLTPGKGYLWAMRKKTGLQAFGTLNNGRITKGVTRNGNVYPGYNLVGNPYPAILDFDCFAADNATLLSQSAYTVLDADRHGYISYCTGASVNPLYASRYLHTHQGFFVQVNRKGNLVFNTGQTLVSAETSFRSAPVAYPLVNLTVTDAEDRKDFTTVEIDRPESGGALKMKGLRGGDGEVSISQNGQEYSIAFVEGRPGSIPVRFTAHAAGSFRLQWDLHHEEFGYLHLMDNLTGAEVDCLAQDHYDFQASTSDYASRFKLLFAPAGMEETDGFPSQDKDFVYLSGPVLYVEGQGRVELFDLQGRLLKSTLVDGCSNRLSVNDLAHGVYLLRLTDDGYSRVQKILLP